MFGRTRFWGRGGAEQPAGGGASVAASASPAAWSEQPAPAASSLPELTPRQSVSTATRDDLAPSGGDPGAARAAEDVAPSPPPSCSCPGGHLGLLHLPTGSGLPLFPLLPREELLSPEELAIKLQGYGQYGCKHYYRRARVFPSCCSLQTPVWCRHCHDEALEAESAVPRTATSVHDFDRRGVARVQCALCDTVQPFGSSCVACGTGFGRYTCLECRFFDDDVSKQQWHCHKCGICRAGGKANFFHCDACGCCYSKSLQDSHTCRERSMHSDCPVCCDFLFDSVYPVTVMACGHPMHEHCLQSLMAHAQFTCPTCMRSVCDMTPLWASRDAQCEATPMPAEYALVRVNTACNDCGTKGEVPFHVLGLKCSNAACGSYNTRRC